MTTTLDRFLAATEQAVALGAFDGDTMTDYGATYATAELRNAVPIAQAILLLGNPLDSGSKPLSDYIAAKHRAIDKRDADETDPDHECDKVAATEDAIFSVALVMGLLLADRV